jgi:Asp-tRNA(Asn)/Glu-tRNA(Gln) amidotransferase A subunit family amidase
MAAAAEARANRGELRSALDGVPITINDLEPTAGIRTTYGTSRFADHVPDSDSVVVERLGAAERCGWERPTRRIWGSRA